MKRIIEEKLVQWAKSERRKPLIVRGARQVGKTYSITQFGQSRFKNMVVLNLEKYPDYHQLFKKNLDAKRMLSEIELMTQSTIIPGQTLLFIDEIQTCPRAIMALRYFFEEYPHLHVIATGSLLEFALGEISFPVGRVQFLEMNPLNFTEYLTAIGHNSLIPLISSLSKGDFSPISSSVHQLLLDELKKYFFVGGMPEAVNAFIKSHSFKDCFEVHAEIMKAYRQDFSKYKPYVDERALELILKGAAQSMGGQIIYTKLGSGFSQPTLKKAFDLLTKAFLITKVESTPHGIPPLGGSLSKRFKALLIDIGLMHHLCGLAPHVEYSKEDLLDIYEGKMAEQFVGQELRGVMGDNLFYWSRAAKSSSAEVDFLISDKEGKIIPIEVKAGVSGRLKSLHLFLNSYPNTLKGVVFSSAPPAILKNQKLWFVPLYGAGVYFLRS